MAELYLPLSRLGIDPCTADGLEFWQIAAILRPTDEDGNIEPLTAPENDQPLTGDALLAARARAARTGESVPEARPMNDAVAEMFGANL